MSCSVVAVLSVISLRISFPPDGMNLANDRYEMIACRVHDESHDFPPVYSKIIS
ncbi:hypothetical protein DY000_02012634 [Brassica cretica]|uniref:Uncharacterized protein n=1 Tax=Brassica cretica TaxID=69181 RepID=A0ABQ7CQK9_BRACR|nr:hypothetical protein DY000_02012634 [Brassica cretica]